MKRFLFALIAVALLAFPVPTAAQAIKFDVTTAGADCTTATACAVVSERALAGVVSFGVYVNVGTSGTFNFEATFDPDTTPAASQVWIAVADDINAASSVTADGARFFSNPGYRRFRVRASAISGAATVQFQAGYAGLRSTATLSGSVAGDGALQDGANSAIEATVFDYASSNPLAVHLVDATGAAASVGGGTQYAVDAALGATPTGTLSVAIRDDALSALTPVEGDAIGLRVDANGALWVIPSGSTTITATNLDVQIGGSDSLTIGTFPDNEPINIAQMNGVTVSMGVGASGTGTQRVASLIHDGTDTALVDGSGNLQITGAVSCSNCTGSGASDVDNSTFTFGTDSVAPAGFAFDDVSPAAITENNVGLARMSSNRVPYGIIRDAAGNERGALVTANNELLVELGAGSAAIGTVTVTDGSGALNVIVDSSATLTVDSELGTAAALADNTANPTLGGVAAFLMCFDGSTWDRCVTSSDWTTGTAAATTAPGTLVTYADFDGAALPTVTGVDTEGEAVPPAASIKGVQYVMIVNEDGSLERGTATTPMIVGDGTGALNVICDSGCAGGTQFAEDVAHTTGDIGTVSLAIRDDTLDARSGAENDYEPLHTNANGALWTIDVNSTASRSALELIDDLVKTEDVAESAGGVGVMAFSVRRDTPATSADTSGDNATLNTNAVGALYVAPGGASVHYRTAAGTTEDEHEIKATAGILYSVLVTNTNAAARYIRCYNLTAASTTPGTSTVFWGAAIPGATTGAGFTYSFPSGLTFDTALTCALTTGAADTDVAEVAANEIKVTYTYR